MAIYGYIRVSTDKQDREHQKNLILEYANKEGLGQVKFIEETISSRVKLENRDINNLLEMLQKGDTLLVAEFSRLARSITEMTNIFSKLVERGVTAIMINNGGIKINGTTDKMTSQIMIFMFAMMAEMERDLISARTKTALANKKARGEKLGRKHGQKVKSKLDPYREQIIELLGKGVAVSSISRILSCHRNTLDAYIKNKKLDPTHADKKF